MRKLSLKRCQRIFFNYLVNLGYKQKTIYLKQKRLEVFFEYLSKRGIDDIRSIDREAVKNFLLKLEVRISRMSGEVLQRRSRKGIFSDVKLFFKALYLEELILTNPTRELKYKPSGVERKKEILSQEEMTLFLEGLNENTLLEARDKAIFELIYSSGLHAGELCSLKPEDVDFTNRIALLRETKFGKDRIVPVSEVAIKFLKRYLNLRRLKREYLFLNQAGGPLTPGGVNLRFKKLLKEAGLYRKGISVHSIRHSTAVHLLSNGADLRYVQELLGHESIETTVAYTHDLEDKIRSIYKSYHPRENIAYVDFRETLQMRLFVFKAELKKAMEIRDKKRKYKRRYYENNRQKGRKSV